MLDHLVTDLDFLAAFFTLLYLLKLLFFAPSPENAGDASGMETIKRSLLNQQVRRRALSAN